MTLNNLTSVYVPPLAEENLREFTSLQSIIKTLRGPNGCPWDIKQTHLSLKKYLIEEAYELLEAIDEDDIDHMIEELGDVLLQVMLHSQIGEDEGMFTIEDVIEGVSTKMIRRHPHVFGNVEVQSAEDVIANWKEIKAEEKKDTNSASVSALDGIGKGLPAVIRAFEIQKKAAKTGFDWEKAEDAWLKVKEEIEEFQTELSKEDKEKQIYELGDLLFAIINTARLLSIHPEEALERANQKFIRRFAYIEQQVHKSGKPIESFDLKDLDQFWDEAKRKGL
jgi:tetrapyrrole methylase family protein/MazG family protein